MQKSKKKVKIIYASASGNTLLVAKYVKDRLLDEMFDADIYRAELTDPQSLNSNDIIIFAISTWEHGMPNPHFDDLIEFFRKNKNDLNVAFIGLGDLRYEPILFCGGMNILKEVVVKNGGKELLSPLRINGDPHDKLDSLVDNWLVSLLKKINS